MDHNSHSFSNLSCHTILPVFKVPPHLYKQFDISGCIQHSRSSLHNSMVQAVKGIIIHTRIDLRFCHIPRKDNVRVDLPSRLLLNKYRQKFPTDYIHLQIWNLLENYCWCNRRVAFKSAGQIVKIDSQPAMQPSLALLE